MKLADRTAFYAKETGLSKAAVARYRKSRINDWTKTADRKIASTIRAAEALADEPKISWAEWKHEMKLVLHEIHDFVAGFFDTVADFVDRLASAVERVLNALSQVLSAAAPAMAIVAAILTAQ